MKITPGLLLDAAIRGSVLGAVSGYASYAWAMGLYADVAIGMAMSIYVHLDFIETLHDLTRDFDQKSDVCESEDVSNGNGDEFDSGSELDDDGDGEFDSVSTDSTTTTDSSDLESSEASDLDVTRGSTTNLLGIDDALVPVAEMLSECLFNGLPTPKFVERLGGDVENVENVDFEEMLIGTSYLKAARALSKYGIGLRITNIARPGIYNDYRGDWSGWLVGWGRTIDVEVFDRMWSGIPTANTAISHVGDLCTPAHLRVKSD